MIEKYKNNIIKFLVPLSFLVMLIVNFLAVSLPINNITPGEISDSYPNLFAPAGITFSIWSVIYTLLLGFVLYTLNFLNINKNNSHKDLVRNVSRYFIISSFVNASWIFAWHYRLIPLSLILMIILLICLIQIARLFKNTKLSLKESIFLKLPFSIYFGWITVATIANVTTLLVSLNWNGFGISPTIWTIVVLITGLLIGIATSIKNLNVPYILVLVWAYIGILVKHTSLPGFNNQYPAIIYTIYGCLAIFLLTEIFIVFKKNK